MSKKHIIIIALVLLTGYATIASALINPGDTLDPVATNPTECPNGPSDPTCVVTLSVSGVKLNEVAQNFLSGSIQYVNSTGNQHADNLFTRDSSTHNTNILQTFDADIPSSQYIVTIANLGISEYTSPGTFTIGETITGATSGATATISYLFEPDVVVMYLENIVGTFTVGETITGDTSGVTATFFQFFPLPVTGDPFVILDTGAFTPSGTGTIDGVSGNTFTVTVTAGTLNQHDIILDDPDGPSYAAGILSITPVPAGTTSVTQGFRTLGTNGSELVWSPVVGSLRSVGVGTKGVQWTAGGNTFYLPETTPTIGQALSIIGNTGSEYALGWGGGSTGPVSANGSTLYSSGLDSTGDYDGNNIFLGDFAGNSVNNANNSNFLGYSAGQYASDANNSNFLGYSAGYNAQSASYSNFFGQNAGQDALKAFSSNFLGYSAGQYATYANNSNFVGNQAGYSAQNAYNSNFFGASAGQDANDAYNSNFFGILAGYQAISANNSNFFGPNAGQNASKASYSNFFGAYTGQNATDANNSNFFGNTAGYNAQNAYNSNFFGAYAGQDAIDARNSNFLGNNAGFSANQAFNSNFIGSNAGYFAGSANNSTFLGNNAGNSAIYAYSSNFFGPFTGYEATNANSSNFFGPNAGQSATNANNSNFFGPSAGYEAFNASNSIFIGSSAGNSDTVNNTNNSDDFSILIGPNTSTGGFSNSIALGGYATNTTTNQLMIGSTTRRIDSMVFNGGIGNTCIINALTGISCSSDERLKTNITDLTTNTLDKVLSLKTVTYNWKTDQTGKSMIGFIAQDLQSQFPELVSENIDGMLSVNYAGMTPVLVEAIREMNLNITNITNMSGPNAWRDALIGWLGDVGNGIGKLFASEIQTDKLCVGQTCVTESQLQQLLQNQNVSSITPSVTVPVVTTDPSDVVSTDTGDVDNEPVTTTDIPEPVINDTPTETGVVDNSGSSTDTSTSTTDTTTAPIE